MSFTNGQLAQKIVDLISYWSGFNDQYHQWLTGSVGGGPNSDGRYPLTDWTGYTVNVQCPAQLEEDVLSLVNGAASSEAAAIAAANTAALALQDCIAQVALATTARQDAETAQVAAELAQAGAEDARAVAIAQANAAANSNTAAIQASVDALASEVAAAASAAQAAQSAIDAAAAIGLPDAPNDGQQYARKNQAWSVVTGGSGGGGDVSYAPDGDIPVFVGTDKQFNLGDELFENSGTGVTRFDGFTWTLGGTDFTIGITEGCIIDHVLGKFHDIDLPAAVTGVVPVVTNGTTYVYLNTSGNITLTATPPTEGDRRTKLYLGRVATANGLIIGAAEGPTVLFDGVNQTRDLAEALLAFSIFGNQIGASSQAMKLSKTAGSAFLMGSNFHTDSLNPNERPVPAADPLQFKYAGRTIASSSPTVTDTLDPNTWDDNGTITTGVSNKQATLQRVYLSPATAQFGIQYGQQKFQTLAKAAQAVAAGDLDFVINPLIEQNQPILLATIAMTGNCTDLTDETTCQIFLASRFGDIAVGPGPTSVSSLQDVYNNTIGATSITLRDELLGQLVVRDAATTAIKGANVFGINNGANSPLVTVDNTGLITTSSQGTSAQWNTAFGWGDHSTAGYLTSYTETDPVFSASAASGVTSGLINNWNTAFGWGDHATAGYLTSYTETDPVFSASAASGITVGALNNWNTAFGWGNHATAGYLSSIPASYVENNVAETISAAWSFTGKPTFGSTTGWTLGNYTVTAGTDDLVLEQQIRFSLAGGSYIGLSTVPSASAALVDTDQTDVAIGGGLLVAGNIRKFNGGAPLPVLTLTNTAYPTGGNVTISTGAPSGGVDGDFWVQYS